MSHHIEAANCRASSFTPRVTHITCPLCRPVRVPRESSHVITTTFRKDGVDHVRLEHYSRSGQTLTEPLVMATKDKALARAHWTEITGLVLVNPSVPATWAERHDAIEIPQNEEVKK